MSKITKDKLTGSNFSQWNKTIRIYFRSIAKDDHLNEEPHDSKEWLRDDQIFLLNDICKDFCRAELNKQSLQTYCMQFNKMYEELNIILPFSPDVKVQQNQREKMAVLSFLAWSGSTI